MIHTGIIGGASAITGIMGAVTVSMAPTQPLTPSRTRALLMLEDINQVHSIQVRSRIREIILKQSAVMSLPMEILAWVQPMILTLLVRSFYQEKTQLLLQVMM
ncbi:hypothetical protein [Commensalibacter melissae]|uniref:hypothetical protein n=1 Tax=Commensalibacter melissae TaxID=2070537 RepID=UPI0012D8AC15|nr:hypothetical protein [Commensalibacter melissae]MUG09080.1 hypothetical protein [Commensalibacter melissae]